MIIPGLPTDWKSWGICFAGILAITRVPSVRNISGQTWRHSVLAASLAASALMALFTALGFIPDDWSANRLSWSAGLLKGYPLYPGEEGPSNGFFYPPVGAWFYLPAAFFTLKYQAPWIGQLIGWCLSIACVFLPLSLCIRSSRESSLQARILAMLLVFCLVMASPPLRYVATMIHVDAPSLLFAGLALLLFQTRAPLTSVNLMSAGLLLALAAWTKQSTWPLLPAFLTVVMLLSGWRRSCVALLVSVGGLLVLSCISFIFESPSEMARMIWSLPLRQQSATPLSVVIPLFFREGWPVLLLSAGVTLGAIIGKPDFSGRNLRPALAMILLGAWMVPFVIMTRTKLGGDSNHFALPLFCLLMGAASLLPQIFDTLLVPHRFETPQMIMVFCLLLLPLLALAPYVSTSCGWYLWTHNSQQQAMERLRHPHDGLYLPWQVLPMLMTDGRLYHIDDCLRYENGMGWHRSRASLTRFLPAPLAVIAIRPFGAPSYLADRPAPQGDTDPMLPGWTILLARPITQ